MDEDTNVTELIINNEIESAVEANENEKDMFDSLVDLEYVKCESANDCLCETSKRINFGICEDYKEVCLTVEALNCQTRLLRVLVNVNNVCKNRYLAVSVVLVKPKNNLILSQKGKVIFTGACNKVSKEFCFSLPGNICGDPCEIDVKVVANYIYTNPFGTLC